MFHRTLWKQNLLIAVASWFFYAWWDWRYLALIFISTIVDFSIGLELAKCSRNRKRKLLLFLSLITNIGILGFFKYYNFFLDAFVDSFNLLGKEIDPKRLNIVLPVGISFYTFQTMSYTIDVYRRKLSPNTDIIAFSAFVSFFPQLVAGPIERATRLLPQFHKERHFSTEIAVDGLRQMLWGLFKKIVIADNCALFVDQAFNSPYDHSGSTLLIGIVFFSFQIYCDFSGYSDIAIGTSKLFGFKLMKNFAYPYFSRDIAEFWRRWHITLSTWFRDYLYIPLGGSRGRKVIIIRNTLITFIISGLWHGANWTFILWGVLNAILFLPLLLRNRNRIHIDIVAKNRSLPSPKEAGLILLTFIQISLTWVLFRSENLVQAVIYYRGLFSTSLFSIPDLQGMKKALVLVVLILIFLVVEWIGRTKEHGLEVLALTWKREYRISLYYVLLLLIFIFGVKAQSFIYFQF